MIRREENNIQAGGEKNVPGFFKAGGGIYFCGG